MDRYKKTFSKLKKKNKKAFIPFTVIGDPNFEISLDIVKTFVDSGADIIELGLPFSDPIADGPLNQRAGIRSLNSGMNTNNLFKFVKEIRKYTDIPIGLLCYYNTILSYDISSFYKRASLSGIDSILIADSTIEESKLIINASNKYGIKTVFIISELSDKQRIKKITEKTTGFIYLASRPSITGLKKNVNKNLKNTIKTIKKISNKPICVGFGISNPLHVKEIAGYGADGIICGSAIVKIIEQNLNNKIKMLNSLKRFIQKMKRAT